MAVCGLFPASGVLSLPEEAYAGGLQINNRFLRYVVVLNISFFDATEEGGHSLSPEKFAKQRRYWFQVGLTIILLLCY